MRSLSYFLLCREGLQYAKRAGMNLCVQVAANLRSIEVSARKLRR